MAYGDDGEGQRLFCVSAGNIYDTEKWKNYPDANDIDQIHDPAQAWNALTVGAYTEKISIDGATYPDWRPVAPPGGLSPSSTTSVNWRRSLPHKPDVVLEGGNAALNPATGDVDPIDDLALLTTHWELSKKLYEPTGDTSAAAAQASRLAAILMARYPDYWPETIRALVVHSARWTDEMKRQASNVANQTQHHQLLLRRYGWGVPDLGRACWSATNVLTLVAQESLRPYGDKTGTIVPTQDMHFHALPWPTEQLRELFDEEVRLRVTLSYFIEPNPARRGWKYRHLYPSHGLRFTMPKPGEGLPALKARVNKQAQDAVASPDFKEEKWKLGVRNGSIISDWWEGAAADLATRGYIAVYPVTGWWKERPDSERWRRSVRYSLVVSIEVPEVGVDIYTPVATAIEAAAAVEVGS